MGLVLCGEDLLDRTEPSSCVVVVIVPPVPSPCSRMAPSLGCFFPSFRTELLKLLLTCFSEAMYLPPSSDSSNANPWVQFFCSTENR